MKLDPTKTCGVTFAVRNCSPVSIRELNVGWWDKSGHYQNFFIPNIFHIPDSPDNILGLSTFSKDIGDFQIKGTRINLSS